MAIYGGICLYLCNRPACRAKTIRDWNSLSDYLIFFAEGAEYSVDVYFSYEG